jgi:spermidine/putrescine transport system permease protein
VRSSEALEPTKAERRRAERAAANQTGIWYPRGYWTRFATPGTLWMLLFFVVPFYVIVSVAFGTVDPVFRSPLPVYQPWWWSFDAGAEAIGKILGPFRPAYIRTLPSRARQLDLPFWGTRWPTTSPLRRAAAHTLPDTADLAVLVGLMRMLAWRNL